MVYVDAIHEKEKDQIHIVERINGQRVYNTIPASYVFYYEDHGGKYRNMWGQPVSRVQSSSYKAFQKELRAYSGRKTYESDVNPVFRCLEDNYKGVDTPKLNLAFFDIEVDFDPKRGFAKPEDPFSPITAISVHLSHLDKMVTLVLKPNLPETHPDFLSWEKAEEICARFDNCILCNDEEQLLNYFLDLIEDSDVLSGWNSTGFDIPYVVNRIERILGKDYSKKLCLWGRRPRKRKYIKFKKEFETYELTGRIHLDYLDLYKKHNPQELHSYRLDYVGEVEVGENKTPYEGTLDQLYKRDFEKFIEYNRQDTFLLVKIDKKRKFIELANQIAHTNTVLLPTTMGSVALIEQSIINEAHDQGMVVPNRRAMDFNVPDYESDDEHDEDEEEQGPAVGAYVAKPKIGIHEEIGSIDINSLYPSTLRSLNMGPETLVGQIRSPRTDALIAERVKAGVPRAEAWHGLYSILEFDDVINRTDEMLTVDFEDGQSVNYTGKELYDLVYNQSSNLCLSANGTLFRTDVGAIIPGLLARWYSERKRMQGWATTYKDLTKSGIEYDESKLPATSDGTTYMVSELHNLIKENPNALRWFIEQGVLEFREGKLWAKDASAVEIEGWRVFWDQRQQARKILLNSLYGALLNEGCRFYDHRIGQSVTLTGRSIARHMNSKVNEIITGTYQIDGDAIIYADTDSSYFSAAPMLKKDPNMVGTLNDRDAMISLYDNIGEMVNESFPEFMHGQFNTSLERGAIIKAGREIVASRGLFITKKRYALLYYDLDGTRYDVNNKPGKIKAMGLDLKRADTPKIMQQFLEEVLLELLNGATREDIITRIKEFRTDFRKLDGWLKGTPKKVNGITNYTQMYDERRGIKDVWKVKGTVKERSSTIPGHVLAAINWNTLRQLNGDNYSMEIQDGAKVIVCKLRPNALKMTSVAYPFDEPHIPDWFKQLPFDHELMEETIIDSKIDNLIGVLKWDLRDTRDDTTFNDLFGF